MSSTCLSLHCHTAFSAKNHRCVRDPAFAWQQGCAFFTVSATARKQVIKFVANQESHHRQKSFQEELVELWERAGIR